MFAIDNRGILLRGMLRRTFAGALAVVTVAAVLASPVVAQRYKSIKPKMTIKESKAVGLKVSDAMRSLSAFNSGGKAAIDRYFGDYFFRQMTQYTPTHLVHLSKYRENLFKRFLRPAPVKEAQEHLTNLALKTSRSIARGNYHPAVRYNATLILGMLDQRYSVGGAQPVVLPAATNDLLELLEQDKFNDVKVHPSVKVGALEGLERHARFGLDAQYAERVTKAALAVLAQEPSTKEVDADVNHWIKCKAARVLARQFKEGPSKEVHAALTKLIANSEMGLDDRCCIAGLLDMMTYKAGADTDAAATIVPLGKLTKAVVAEGAEKARAFEDLILGNGGGGRGNFGGRGRGVAGPKLERRQLLACVTLIKKGAKSLGEGLSDKEKQKVQLLTDLITPVMTISIDKKSLDLEVAEGVIKLENTINNIVASWQPAVAPADAVEAGFAE